MLFGKGVFQFQKNNLMRFIFFILALSVLCFSTNFFKSCSPSNRNVFLKETTIAQLDEVIIALETLKIAPQESMDNGFIQPYFQRARLAYKKTEAVIEYYFQGLTKRINGPALPDVKVEDGQVFPPNGFQVIEQFVYGVPINDSSKHLLNECADRLIADIKFVKTNLQAIEILPRHAAELVQHELLRIAAIGVTGADAPLSKLSIEEAGAALEGLALINGLPNTVANQIQAAIKFTKAHTNFDEFDRLEFITHFLMPLSEEHFQLVQKSLVNDSFAKPFSGSMAQLMRGEGINPDYFTAYKASASTAEKLLLGKMLFYSTQLSKNKKMSCGSCHNSNKYFTDGLAKAVGNIHGKNDRRNTPSIYYAALQANQFYDMRSAYLEDQVNEVMKSSDEFNISANEIAALLQKDKELETAFNKAYSNIAEISGVEVRNALAVFIRNQIPFSSRFDRYMRGGFTLLNHDEKAGFNLFAGKGKCATCHFMPWFNGTVPPWYNKSESEIIGVPQTAEFINARLDGDLGRYRINAFEELKFAFKTPTLRNVEKTGPYMHNGVYSRLEEVLQFYQKGGGLGLGIDLPFQSLPFDSLQLNLKEQAQIIAFMQTLTDSTGY